MFYLAIFYIIVYNTSMDNKYISSLHNMDVQASGLLGSFDDDDSYVIDTKILAELKICNKLITEYKADLITAHAIVGGFKIDFLVYIQEGEDNKKRAGLFVKESSKLGLIQKELQTYVDDIVLENTGAFLDEVKKEFHLYTMDESTGVDMDNLTLLAIINRKKSLKGLYDSLIPFMVDIDKEYVLSMLALLKASGYYGEQMLIEIRNLIKEKKLDKRDPRYWRELKLLLDKAILKNYEIFDKVTQEKIETLQNLYSTQSKSVKLPQKSESKPKKKSDAPKKKKDDKKKKKEETKDKPKAKSQEVKKDKPKGPEIIYSKVNSTPNEAEKEGKFTKKREFEIFGEQREAKENSKDYSASYFNIFAREKEKVTSSTPDKTKDDAGRDL